MLDVVAAPSFRFGVLGGLPAGGGAGIGNFALFAASDGFRSGGGLGAACRFHALGRGDASCLLGLMDGLLMGVLGLSWLVGHGDFLRLTGGSFGEVCGGLGACLGPELLFVRLFGGTVSELCTIFAAGGGEVPVLGAVKVRPGVQNGDVFGRFHGGQIFDSLGIALFHGGRSYCYW